MITISATAADVLTGSHRRYFQVDAWRSGVLLSSDVPVESATLDADRTLGVPERLSLTVPRIADGVSMSPVADDSPLAANGQRLHVKVGIGLGNGVVEWFQLGVYLIQESTVDGDSVSVTAVGLLALIDEARLVNPFQPNGTFVSTLRALVEPALTVVIDPALVDRSVPMTGINYDEDRLTAVRELLSAWPADAFVNASGYLSVVPTTQSTTPVLSLSNGTGGTIVTASGSSTREGAANVVVARGTASDGAQVQGVAYDYSGGPKSYGGPFNPLPVPYFFFSPLLTTIAQCESAAASILAKLQRGVGKEFKVEMVPHPALQLGDVVSVTTDDYTNLLCSVEAFTLPLNVDGGLQAITVRSIA